MITHTHTLGYDHVRGRVEVKVDRYLWYLWWWSITIIMSPFFRFHSTKKRHARYGWKMMGRCGWNRHSHTGTRRVNFQVKTIQFTNEIDLWTICKPLSLRTRAHCLKHIFYMYVLLANWNWLSGINCPLTSVMIIEIGHMYVGWGKNNKRTLVAMTTAWSDLA